MRALPSKASQSAELWWCYGRVQKIDVCPRGRTESWAGPWPIGRAMRRVVSKHFDFGARCMVGCKAYE